MERSTEPQSDVQPTSDWRLEWHDREAGAAYELAAVCLGIDPSRLSLTPVPTTSATDAINRFNNGAPSFQLDLGSLSDDERRRLERVLVLVRESLSLGSLKPLAAAFPSAPVETTRVRSSAFAWWLRGKSTLESVFAGVPQTWANVAFADALSADTPYRRWLERWRQDAQQSELIAALEASRAAPVTAPPAHDGVDGLMQAGSYVEGWDDIAEQLARAAGRKSLGVRTARDWLLNEGVRPLKRPQWSGVRTLLADIKRIGGQRKQ